MKDCEKLKKRFYIGVILAFFMGFIKVIDESIMKVPDLVSFEIFLVIIILLFVLCLYLCMPYIMCISNYNNKKF